MNLGMQRLYATVEHLRKAGEIGDVEDRKSGFAQCSGSTSGRNQFDAVGGELLGEGNESRFVSNTEKCAPHLFIAAQKMLLRLGDLGWKVWVRESWKLYWTLHRSTRTFPANPG